MKKLLLCATAAILSVGSAFAVTDGQTYAPTNGITCKNLWTLDRIHSLEAYRETKVADKAARTACLHDGVIYVGNSAADEPEIVDDAGAVLNVASIDKFSMVDGSYLGRIKLTLDGVRHTGTLCANQVGFDSFGNLWVAPAAFSLKTGYKVYTVDPATGAMTLQGALPMTFDARIDYCDLIGDVTRVNAKCTVMAAGGPEVGVVYKWVAEQGGAFEGGWAGDDNIVYSEFYPADQTVWGNAPTVTIVPGDGESTYDAGLYYIDGFVTQPTLYNEANAISDSFANAAPDLAPVDAGTNGVAEMTLGGKNFLIYSYEQYVKGGTCKSYICELGAGMTFAGMTKYWQIPEDGLGAESDGGNRGHFLNCQMVKDAAGKEGAYLMTFKCYNGFGVYLIAEEGFAPAGVNDATVADGAIITVKGTVITVSEEASEITIVNLAGQTISTAHNATEIAAPAAGGVYIVKAIVAGAPVIKKVVL